MSHLSQWIIVSVCSLVTPCRCFPCRFCGVDDSFKTVSGFDVIMGQRAIFYFYYKVSINRKSIMTLVELTISQILTVLGSAFLIYFF